MQPFLANLIAEQNEIISISRPKSRISWGVDVPSDPSHSVYVWLDALVNYLTAIGYPEKDPRNDSYAASMVHVVGKDILKFHGSYWPAFLSAAGFPLPKGIIAHSHWLKDGVTNQFSLIRLEKNVKEHWKRSGSCCSLELIRK